LCKGLLFRTLPPAQRPHPLFPFACRIAPLTGFKRCASGLRNRLPHSIAALGGRSVPIGFDLCGKNTACGLPVDAAAFKSDQL